MAVGGARAAAPVAKDVLTFLFDRAKAMQSLAALEEQWGGTLAERNARRAEAVKSYLVKERGIEEARVTAREVGSTRPLDSGTSAMAHAKNRRVDVIFVPEGATVPENDD